MYFKNPDYDRDRAERDVEPVNEFDRWDDAGFVLVEDETDGTEKE